MSMFSIQALGYVRNFTTLDLWKFDYQIFKKYIIFVVYLNIS